MNDINNNNQAIIDVCAKLGEPRCAIGFKPYTIVPEGTKVHEFERLLDPERPQRIKASPSFDTSSSLIEYFNTYKDESSVLFADLDTSTVRAVFDYHQPLIDPPLAPPLGGARYCEHKANYTAKYSLEWATWVGNSGRKMTQEGFAVFIEDNAPDVLAPTATDLYAMALSLEAAGKSEFKTHKRLEDGSVSLTFVEEVNGTSNGIPFPKQIEVTLRPYLGCAPVKLIAKLRFRAEGGKLTLWYDLLRHEQAKREAFESIVDHIGKRSETAVFSGRPS